MKSTGQLKVATALLLNSMLVCASLSKQQIEPDKNDQIEGQAQVSRSWASPSGQSDGIFATRSDNYEQNAKHQNEQTIEWMPARDETTEYYERVVSDGSAVSISCPHLNGLPLTPSTQKGSQMMRKRKGNKRKQIKWFRNHVPLQNLSDSHSIPRSSPPLLWSAASELAHYNEPSSDRKLDNLQLLSSNSDQTGWHVNTFGELVINKVSQYFAGRYTCLAMGRRSEVLIDVLPTTFQMISKENQELPERAFASRQAPEFVVVHQEAAKVSSQPLPAVRSELNHQVSRGRHWRPPSQVRRRRVPHPNESHLLQRPQIHLVESESILAEDVALIPGFLYTKQQIHCPNADSILAIESVHLNTLSKAICSTISSDLAGPANQDVSDIEICESLAKRLIVSLVQTRNKYNCSSWPLEVIWFKDGQEITFDSDTGQASNSNLDIKLIDPSSAYKTEESHEETADSIKWDELAKVERHLAEERICAHDRLILEIEGVQKESAGYYTCALRVSLSKLEKIVLRLAPDDQGSLNLLDNLWARENPFAPIQTFSLVVATRAANSSDLWSTILQAERAYGRRKQADFKRLKWERDLRISQTASRFLDSRERKKRQTNSVGETNDSQFGPFGLNLEEPADSTYANANGSIRLATRQSTKIVGEQFNDQRGTYAHLNGSKRRKFDRSAHSSTPIGQLGINKAPDMSNRWALATPQESPLNNTFGQSHESSGRLRFIDSALRRYEPFNYANEMYPQAGDIIRTQSNGVQDNLRAKIKGHIESKLRRIRRYSHEIQQNQMNSPSESPDLNSPKFANLPETVNDMDNIIASSVQEDFRMSDNKDRIGEQLIRSRLESQSDEPTKYITTREESQRNANSDASLDGHSQVSQENKSGLLKSGKPESGQQEADKSRPSDRLAEGSEKLANTPIASYSNRQPTSNEVPNNNNNNKLTFDPPDYSSNRSSQVVAFERLDSYLNGDTINEGLMWTAGQYLYMHIRAFAASSIYGLQVDIEWSNERTNITYGTDREPDDGARDAVPFATLDVISGQNLHLQCTAHAHGRLPEVSWYKKIGSYLPSHLAKYEHMSRKIGGDYFWPLTELDLLNENQNGKRFVWSQTSTVFDNLVNQSFTVVKSLQLSEYHDKGDLIHRDHQVNSVHSNIPGPSLSSPRMNLYACLVVADFRNQHAILGVHFRETPAKMSQDIGKRLQAKTAFIGQEADTMEQNMDQFASYNMFRDNEIRVPIDDFWISLKNKSLLADNLNLSGSSITPAILSMMIVFVFTSLLALVYLTLRSYRNLKHLQSEFELDDAISSKICPNKGVIENVDMQVLLNNYDMISEPTSGCTCLDDSICVSEEKDNLINDVDGGYDINYEVRQFFHGQLESHDFPKVSEEYSISYDLNQYPSVRVTLDGIHQDTNCLTVEDHRDEFREVERTKIRGLGDLSRENMRFNHVNLFDNPIGMTDTD